MVQKAAKVQGSVYFHWLIRGFCVVAVLLEGLSVSTPAFAWTASKSGGTLTIDAGPGEVNQFEIGRSVDTSVVVVDRVDANRFSGPLPASCAAIRGGLSCRAGEGFVSTVNLYAKDGNDQFDASTANMRIAAFGGDGDDTYTGGSQRDVVFGDGGNDVARLGDGGDDFYGGVGSDEVYGGGVVMTLLVG